MRGGDGLFEVEPVEKQQAQGRPVGVDKRFRAFDRTRSCCCPRRWTTGCAPALPLLGG